MIALQAGQRVTRAGWNSKGMYLWWLPPAVVKKEWVRDPMLLATIGSRDEINCLPAIRMLTATGEVVTGWVASQPDMLAKDWCIED